MSEIIQAVFASGKTFVKTEPQWRYNKGQKLQIFGLDLPEYFEAHFSNEIDGVAKSMLGQNGLVSVPSEYFVSGENIYCWLYIQEGEAHVTKCQIRIPLYDKGELTDEEPTPEQKSAWDEAVDTLNDTIEAIPTTINTALAEAKASGEFDGQDGADGNNAWTVDVQYTRILGRFVQVMVAHMVGPSGVTAKAGDVVFISDGRFTQISQIVGQRADTTLVGDLHGVNGDPGQDGQDGVSPEITVTEITGGHRVTITDEDHPDGQSFDVMDGEQGPAGPSGGQFWSATSAYTSPDYTWAFNKLSGPTGATPLVGDLVYYSTYRYTVTSVDAVNETVNCTIRASIRGQQGPAGQDGYSPTVTVTDITGGHRVTITDEDGDHVFDVMDGTGGGGSSVEPYTSNPAALGTASPGSSDKYARGDHVHAKPTYTKSDVGLGYVDNVQQYSATNPPPYPVSSVNGQTGAVSLSIPSTASDVGAVAVAQGVAHAGEFVVVGSDGNITTVTMSVWQGGSY